MTLLRWKDEYSVGIDAVDHEHKELIDLINQLYDSAVSRRSREAVLAFFGDLFKSISRSF